MGRELPRILAEAREEYDLVVIDSPPLLAFAESLEIAAATDGVLLLAVAGETSSESTARNVHEQTLFSLIHSGDIDPKRSQASVDAFTQKTIEAHERWASGFNCGAKDKAPNTVKVLEGELDHARAHFLRALELPGVCLKTICDRFINTAPARTSREGPEARGGTRIDTGAPTRNSRPLVKPAPRLAALALFAAACGQPAAAPPPPPAVTVARPVVEEIVEWDEYTARLEAVDSVEVRARVSGYLQSIHFRGRRGA